MPAKSKVASRPCRKIVIGVTMFGVVCLVAVVGYVAAGWRVDDALYMVVITIFGVGYGEVHPVTSPGLRCLTILTIVAGYAAVIYTVGGFMQMLIDGELNQALGARRMTREIAKLQQHTIICGIGRLGSILAKELHEAGKPFVVVDCDRDRLEEAQERGYLVLEGDASEEETLEHAGIERASVVATVLSSDATNVFVTITARGMNPDLTIIARAESPRTEKKLTGSGADEVVLPTAIGAHRVAQLIVRPTAEKMLSQLGREQHMADELKQIGLRFDELPITPASLLVGQALSEIEIRGNHGFLIVGIRRSDGSNLMNPPPETVLDQGDVVIVLGHENDIPELNRKFAADPIVYRGARSTPK